MSILNNSKRNSQWKIEKDAYMKSSKWFKIRKKVLKRDSYMCQACMSKNNLDVHHITYEYTGEEVLENLVAICRDCHSELHEELGFDYYNTFEIDSIKVPIAV